MLILMKNLFAIALPLVFLVACNSVEKHRAGIETLATQWDETTNQVTEFAGTVQAEQASFQQNLAGLVVAEDAMAKVKEDKKNLVTEAYASFQNAGASYASISAEIGNFVATWTEKAAEVNALKEGLAAGKLEGDVAAKVAELTTTATEASAQLTTWKEQLEATKSAVAAQQTQYQTVVAEVIPAK